MIRAYVKAALGIPPIPEDFFSEYAHLGFEGRGRIWRIVGSTLTIQTYLDQRQAENALEKIRSFCERIRQLKEERDGTHPQKAAK